MNGILDLINSDMGQQLISGTGNQMGLDKNTTLGALSTAIPLILGAMKNNSSSAEGSEQILSALGNSKHSGSMLDLKYQYLDSTNYNNHSVDNNSKETEGLVYMISGCMDSQTSADAYINNKFQGVFSSDQEWPDATKSTDINLQDPNYVNGGVFVYGDLVIDGAGGGGKGKGKKKKDAE